MKSNSKNKPLSQKQSVMGKSFDSYKQLKKVADRIEKMRLGDYIDNMNHPWRVIWLNLLGGISRGVGLTIGATLVIALLFKLLGALIAMNIPYLTGVLQDVVQIIKVTPGVEKFVPAKNINLTESVSQMSEDVKLKMKNTH